MPTTSSTETGSRMDLAARAIDLTNTLLRASRESNPNNLLLEVVYWLGREKVNADQLQDFMGKASGLTFPNRTGQMYLDEVGKRGEAKLTAHLSLRQSGSLGRLLVADPRLCWVPSTVACLYQCHSDVEFVAEAICECILQDSNTHKTVVANSFRPNYLERLQLKTVVEKIVSSVWFCVVNSGHQLPPLPSELTSICPSGHFLDKQQFGKILRALQSDYPKFIVRSRFLFLNLVIWLHYHFNGVLQVTVSSKIVYKKTLGDSRQEIDLNVQEFCSQPCSLLSTASTYELLTEVAGDYTCLLHQKTDYPNTRDAFPVSGARQPLYQIQSSLHINPNFNVRTKSFQIVIRTVAQDMMQWLLNISLVEKLDKVRSLSEVGFWAKFDPVDAGQRSYKVADILKCHPTMFNMPWGERRPNPTVFSRNTGEQYGEETRLFDIDAYFGSKALPQESKTLGIEDVIRYFPILQDMLDKDISPNCKCFACSQTHKGPTGFKKGCLCTMAVIEVLILVGHGIADAFGCPDQSGTTDNELLVDLMKKLLVELCRDEMVCWNTWFSVAARVYLGFPTIPKRDPNDGGTIGAIQHGNIVAIASWIDLDVDVNVRGCFGMICGNGRLAVRTATDDPQAFAKSVQDEYAVIYIGGTEQTTSYNERFPKASIPPGASVDLVMDQTDVSTSMVLVPIRDQEFSLMLIISTSEHRRIVDYSKAVEARRWLSVPACDHGSDQTGSLTFDIPSQMMDFNDIVGRWNADARIPEVKSTILHCSDALDSPLKRNIALALSPHGRCVVKDCSICLSTQVQKLSSKRTSKVGLYVIRCSLNERALVRRS
ncbi:hypothetical protein FB567DRAFT_217712 [Paraphoma chrysanthemicola]|uniref:Uncharacterized protein n=1 Tax=Paraphoma chrysanthemicola TaxID=798071 RepID=A0A8K0VT26_9PLEO|nr:hypothetical protein FB567DRAFT_217712 [Paraphoma chrysanthemicola]